MKSKIFLIISMFCFSSIAYSQSYHITKIIETNLFELDNHKKVKLYGLFIPSRQDSHSTLSKLADIIYQWETENLLDANVAIETLGSTEDGTNLVAIYKNYPFFIRKNIANELLSNGWASLIIDINNDYLQSLITYQEEAQKNKDGIWEAGFSVSQNVDTPIINAEEMAVFTSRPYLPLLGISIASFALAWDYFSASSDAQKSIDKLNDQIKLLPNTSTGKQTEQIYNDEIDNLKSIKTRKTIVAVTCVAAGIITTLFSFKSVEVKTNFQSLSLSYKF
ncbi:MAG: thermonuclease family protein [Ignavibacteriaceae bacterium]|nr:thermonuclease family protein [Ignavibacteriaceae bacterium]